MTSWHPKILDRWTSSYFWLYVMINAKKGPLSFIESAIRIKLTFSTINVSIFGYWSLEVGSFLKHIMHCAFFKHLKMILHIFYFQFSFTKMHNESIKCTTKKIVPALQFHIIIILNCAICTRRSVKKTSITPLSPRFLYLCQSWNTSTMNLSPLLSIFYLRFNISSIIQSFCYIRVHQLFVVKVVLTVSDCL